MTTAYNSSKKKQKISMGGAIAMFLIFGFLAAESFDLKEIIISVMFLYTAILVIKSGGKRIVLVVMSISLGATLLNSYYYSFFYTQHKKFNGVYLDLKTPVNRPIYFQDKKVTSGRRYDGTYYSLGKKEDLDIYALHYTRGSTDYIGSMYFTDIGVNVNLGNLAPESMERHKSMINEESSADSKSENISTKDYTPLTPVKHLKRVPGQLLGKWIGRSEGKEAYQYKISFDLNNGKMSFEIKSDKEKAIKGERTLSSEVDAALPDLDTYGYNLYKNNSETIAYLYAGKARYFKFTFKEKELYMTDLFTNDDGSVSSVKTHLETSYN